MRTGIDRNVQARPVTQRPATQQSDSPQPDSPQPATQQSDSPQSDSPQPATQQSEGPQPESKTPSARRRRYVKNVQPAPAKNVQAPQEPERAKNVQAPQEPAPAKNVQVPSKMGKRELLEEQVQIMEALLAKKLGRQIDQFYTTPEDREAYQAHITIFRAGADFRERAAFGGNRVGKSHLGSYEMALHLTGDYPDWWTGHRFDQPIQAWACGVTLDAVRDICQDKLLGPPTALGTGMIPNDAIIDKRRKSGVPDLYDSITVRHITGGASTLQFKAYQSGRESFQGRKIQFIWLDEECDWAVYEECLLRTTSTGPNDAAGKILTTLTPLKGLTEVAEHFLQDGQMMESDDRYAHLIGWDDIPHISGDEKAQLIASIPRHQREARIKGYPSLGIGAVFSYFEDSLLYENNELPAHFRRGFPRNFPKGYGMDVGWNATAAVFAVQNPDDGCWYISDEYKKGELTPVDHAAVIRLKADTGNGSLMGAIDPAARGRSQKDGTRLMDAYRTEGLRLVPAHNAVETSIHLIQTLMDEGRLKIHTKCTGLLAELRQYHRGDNGKVIKRNDHLIDCLRYIVATDRAMTRPRPTNFRPRKLNAGYAWAGSGK